MKTSFVILTAIVAISLAFPVLAFSHLDAVVDISGNLTVHGAVNEVTLEIVIPQNTSNQIVTCNASLSGDEIKTATIRIAKPSWTIPYSVVCNVSVDEREVYTLPEEYSTAGLEKYLKSGDGVEVNDKLKDLAENITADAKNDFEKIAMLSNWVHNYINYDESMTDKYLSTNQILEEKSGVCVEYATLLASLTRSLGYPTRFVGGMAYTNGTFRGHMWVEVYIGRWVAFDPTWNLGGRLDAGHIVFFKSENRQVKSKIRYTSNGGFIEWNTNEFGNVEIISSEESGERMEIINPIKKLPIGEESFIAVKLVGGYEYGEINSIPCNKPIKVIDIDRSKPYYMSPGSALVVWKIKSSDELDNSYVYECPIGFKTLYGENSTRITIGNAVKPEFDVLISDTNPSVGETLVAIITSRSKLKFTGIMGNELSSETGTTATLEFNVTDANPKEIIVTSERGGLFTQKIIPRKTGEIKSVEYPTIVIAGSEVTINVSADGAKTGSIELMTDGIRIRKPINNIVQFKLKFDDVGNHIVKVHLVSNTGEDEKQINIKVVEKPRIAISELRIEGNNVVLLFNTTGDPKDIKLVIDGEETPFRELLVMNMENGFHYILVNWKDLSGKSYTLAKSFTIGSEMREIDVFLLVFTLLLAMAIVLLIIAILLVMGSIRKRAQ